MTWLEDADQDTEEDPQDIICCWYVLNEMTKYDNSHYNYQENI